MQQRTINETRRAPSIPMQPDDDESPLWPDPGPAPVPTPVEAPAISAAAPKTPPPLDLTFTVTARIGATTGTLALRSGSLAALIAQVKALELTSNTPGKAFEILPPEATQPQAAAATGEFDGIGPYHADDGTVWCRKHRAPMRERNKQHDTWYSHNMGSENEPLWCKGYPGKGSEGWEVES